MNFEDRSNHKNGLHVAIIMDGNGRWALSRGKPRYMGHQAGAERTRSIVEACPDLGISTLTLYAFSADNWKRPPYEVSVLLDLFETYLQSEIERCLENGVQLSIIGRRDRLGKNLVKLIENAERITSEGDTLHLRVAIDYSARESIIEAAKIINQNQNISQDEFSKLLQGHMSDFRDNTDVDLLIRTGGEQRLSDFMLWECAYAELYFTPAMWPEFTVDHFREALATFAQRERRFGAIPESQAV